MNNHANEDLKTCEGENHIYTCDGLCRNLGLKINPWRISTEILVTIIDRIEEELGIYTMCERFIDGDWLCRLLLYTSKKGVLLGNLEIIVAGPDCTYLDCLPHGISQELYDAVNAIVEEVAPPPPRIPETFVGDDIFCATDPDEDIFASADPDVEYF